MPKSYYKTKESVEEYIQLSKHINSKQLIHRLKDYLPTKSILLEIGSGPGSDWKLLNSYYKTIGSDYSNFFLNHLINENPEGNFLKLEASKLDTERKFNGIYSNKVLHHLTSNQLQKSIKKQYEILTSNGIICHSFWKGSGTDVFKGMYVHYHDKQSLKKYFQPYYSILVLEYYKEFEDNDSILVIGQKK